MRVLLAPDKFKGTFPAAEVCRHLRQGILSAAPRAEVVSSPMADGGEGTLEIVLAATGGREEAISSSGPLGAPLTGPLGLLPDGSILIESAAFCGMSALGPAPPDPMRASSYGLGVAIREALRLGPSRIIVGLGGSATIDGGLGMARALGFRLRASDGALLEGSGSDLTRLASIDPDASVVSSVPVVGLADVPNRITGPAGAARVFGPQKGASLDEIAALEKGLSNLAAILRRDLRLSVGGLEGGGAAGGLGAGLAAFLAARLVPGARVVATLSGLPGRIGEADCVIAGEGVFDGAHAGKVVGEVARLCLARGKALAVVCARSTGPLPPGRTTVLPLGGQVSSQDLIHAGKSLVNRAFWRD